MFGFDLEMASHWKVFSKDIADLCQQNANRFIETEKYEMAKAWSLVSVSIKNINQNITKLKFWNKHPLGSGIIFKLLEMFQT